MADEMKRIEIGFSGGQVMSVRVADLSLADLRQAIERGQGWHDVVIEDGAVTPSIDRVCRLVDVADAMRDLEAGVVRAKIAVATS